MASDRSEEQIQATRKFFHGVPWCANLLRAKGATPLQLTAGNPRGSPFFSQTLSTTQTVRHSFFFCEKSGDNPDWDVYGLLDLGCGLDGHFQLAHGGFIATVFDEVMGRAALLYARNGAFTGSLNIQYRAAIPTPGIILCKARLERKLGRKVWIEGSIEDGQKETIYAEGVGLWIEIKPSL